MTEMSEDFQVIGVVRFSVLTTDFSLHAHDSHEALAEKLFAPARMALRLRLFEKLCLPSLVRQSDQGFRLVVLTAQALPRDIRARLEALVAPHDNITIYAPPPEQHYQMIKKAYALGNDDAARYRLAFRLDDDDALALDYVARLKALARGLLPLGGDRPQVIAFNRGFYVDMTEPKGRARVFDTVERAPLSCGTALLAPASYTRNPYRYNHRALAQHYTVYSDISAPCFLRTIHGDNHSHPAKLGIVGKMRPEAVANDVQRYFGLDIDMLGALE
ncbi:MAG: putative rhamnosyl transferase [Roseobacter sp.]|nr:putative rhamnosyl transferase [Roseobacter sp.]